MAEVRRFILSPEFGDRMDLERLAREFMERMLRDVGLPLEWVAAVHRNTDYPHVHVALRGSGGLRLPRELVKHGLRRYAEDLCTAQLGYRTELDLQDSDAAR
jgi:type IV secretory pathway VirD2 relaxase